MRRRIGFRCVGSIQWSACNARLIRYGKLTLIAQQLLIGLEEVLRAMALIDELPAAQCHAEADARAKIQGVLNLLCVRLARAELAAQHVLPSGTDNCRPR